MFTIMLLAVGKLKEKYFTAAVAEYSKRLSTLCALTVTELPEERLPENPGGAQIEAGLKKEGERILAQIPKNAWFCVLTPEGKTLSSEAFAQRLSEVKLSGKSTACFLIGSSFGIAPEVKQRADLRLSFGPMTFPHHLMRVMALEQLYRAESIQAGTKYHK